MDEIVLTAEQEEDAERIEDVLRAGARADMRQIARLLASKKDPELFGKTEHDVRDILMGLGARAFDSALEERKKRGIKDPASPAPSAASRPAS